MFSVHHFNMTLEWTRTTLNLIKALLHGVEPKDYHKRRVRKQREVICTHILLVWCIWGKCITRYCIFMSVFNYLWHVGMITGDFLFCCNFLCDGKCWSTKRNHFDIYNLCSSGLITPVLDFSWIGSSLSVDVKRLLCACSIRVRCFKNSSVNHRVC